MFLRERERSLIVGFTDMSGVCLERAKQVIGASKGCVVDLDEVPSFTL